MKTPSVSASLDRRLHVHFIACSTAAVCVGGLAAPKAEAAIIYSGLKNLALPAVGGGQLYLNLVSGATASAAAGLTDWDVAPYGGGASFQPSYAMVPVMLGGSIANLTSGTVISAASNLAAAPGGVPGVAIPDLTTGYIGFKFNPASISGFSPAPNATPTNFGWLRLSVNSATGGSIVDWAYESTPETAITAGAVPEPSALAMLALGTLGITGLRRRRMAA